MPSAKLSHDEARRAARNLLDDALAIIDMLPGQEITVCRLQLAIDTLAGADVTKIAAISRPHIHDDIAIRLVSRLEDTSPWLRALIESGCEREPVDVILDLEKALIAFRSAYSRSPIPTQSWLQ